MSSEAYEKLYKDIYITTYYKKLHRNNYEYHFRLSYLYYPFIILLGYHLLNQVVKIPIKIGTKEFIKPV